MKNIGIIGAMEEEVTLLKDKLKDVETINKANLTFYKGVIGEKNIVLVTSGIGKVNAAICTQILIDLFEVDCVINTGVAGAVDEKLNIADIVIADTLIYHDFDATDFGYKKGIIPRMQTSKFAADKNLITLAEGIIKKNVEQAKGFVGNIVTGDQFVTDKKIKDEAKELFDAYAIEMESAAIAHTSYLNGIPFLILRSISDKADGDATENFDEFVHKAAKIAADIVNQLIQVV